MGSEMVPHLLKAGHEVSVWNRTPAKATALVEQGARYCATIAEVVAGADVLLLCLGDTAAVESVVFGPQGISAHGHAGQLLLDLSSIDPEKTRQFSRRLRSECGMGWVDCPVSGGVAGARDASLVIMAGGTDEEICKAEPVLKCIGQRLTHMGPVGSGQLTKVCNQMIVGCNAMVIAEMIALAQSGGVDAKKIPQALAGGFADSRPLQILSPQMASRTFEPIAWRVKTLVKDLETAVKVSRDVGNSAPMSETAARLMGAHGAGGYEDKDLSTLICMHQENK